MKEYNNKNIKNIYYVKAVPKKRTKTRVKGWYNETPGRKGYWVMEYIHPVHGFQRTNEYTKVELLKKYSQIK